MIHESDSSFILQDIAILQQFTSLVSVLACTYRDLVKIPGAILQSRIVIVWFASGRAASLSLLIAKILRKKILVIAGGTEVSVQSSLRGGGIARLLSTKLIISLADHILCVSHFTSKEMLCLAIPRRYSIAYNGIDTQQFRLGNLERNVILTVAFGEPGRKGIDRYFEVARILSHRKFVLVGYVANFTAVKNSCPTNVLMTGQVSLEKLSEFYQSAKFYLQLSRHESFGVALAEAMASGCIPIVSDAGALPEVVGECGFVVREGDPKKVAKLIEKYWNGSDGMSRLSRARIISHFSLAKRAKILERVVVRLQEENS